MARSPSQVRNKGRSFTHHRKDKQRARKALIRKNRKEGKRGELSLYNRYRGWVD